MAAPVPFPAPHRPISDARGQPCSAVSPRHLSKSTAVPKIPSKWGNSGWTQLSSG